MVTKEILLEKINGLLNGNLTEAAVYQWALFEAVSGESAATVQGDRLMEVIVADLMNLSQKDPKRKPTKPILEYYQICLLGQEEFREEVLKNLAPRVKHEKKEVPKPVAVAPRSKTGRKLFFLGRLYVTVFALAIFILHLVTLVRPDASLSAEMSVASSKLWREAGPQLFYALVLFVPFRFLVRGLLLLVSLPVVWTGAFYYWWVTFSMIQKFDLSIIFVLVIIPFCAAPATVALVLHHLEWKRYRRSTL